MSATHFVPHRFDARPDTLVVSADTRAPSPGIAWGLGCLASGPGEPARGYMLILVGGSVAAAAIARIDAGGTEAGEGRTAQQFQELTSTKEKAVERLSSKHALRLRCSRPAGETVDLRGSVDGRISLSAKDPEGIAPFTAATEMVIALKSGTDIRFDDLTVDDGSVAGP